MIARATAMAAFLSLLGSAAALAADRDRDRMPDSWERRHHVDSPRGDSDRDGLRNLGEHRAKTDPRRRDSDRDGLRDGDEIRFGWHPRRRDTDRDGIRDGRENAGVISAVDGQIVTIRLARRGRLSGRLEDPEALACAPATGPAAPDAGGWLPDSAEPGLDDPAGPEEDFWDPAWGEKPADLDAELDADLDDSIPLARAAQAGDEDESSEAEDAAAEEEAATAEDAIAAAEDCRAALHVGALVHEAVSAPGADGRRLTRLRLVT